MNRAVRGVDTRFPGVEASLTCAVLKFALLDLHPCSVSKSRIADSYWGRCGIAMQDMVIATSEQQISDTRRIVKLQTMYAISTR